MSDKELEPVFQEILNPGNIYIVHGITNINHRPHHFTIGPQHIQPYHLDLTKPCAGYVNDQGEYRNSSKPGFRKCNLLYEAHTFDKVLFLQLKRQAFEDEAGPELKKLVEKMEEHKIAGILFVDTEEQFRVVPRPKPKKLVKKPSAKRAAPKKVAPKKAATKRAKK